MLKEFLSFIKKEKLLVSGHNKTLLAVSGGLDSIVMCDLFNRAGLNFAIAHCNFKLRGKESDTDEKFVRVLAKKYRVPFFIQHFDTKDYATKGKLSGLLAV